MKETKQKKKYVKHLNKTFKDLPNGCKEVITYCGDFLDYESSTSDVSEVTCKKCKKRVEEVMIPKDLREKLKQMAFDIGTISYVDAMKIAEVAWRMCEAENAEVKKRAENSIRNIQDELDRSIADAVKSERERCLEILRELQNRLLKGDVASMLFGSGQKTKP